MTDWSKMSSTACLPNVKLLSDSYSVMGTKTLTISVSPCPFELRFEDSGGWLSDRKSFSITLDMFIASSRIVFVRANTTLYVHTTLADGEISFTVDSLSSIALLLREYFERSIPADTPRCFFPAVTSTTSARRFLEVFKASGFPTFFDLGYVAPDSPIISDLENRSAVPIGVRIRKDELLLFPFTENYESLATKLSSSALSSASVDGHLIRIQSPILIKGITVDGISLDFVTPELARQIGDQLGLQNTTIDQEVLQPKKDSKGLTSRVTVDGFIDGQRLAAFQCDAELTNHEIRLTKDGSKEAFCVVELSNENLALGGISTAFLLSTDSKTVIQIQPSEAAFHTAILTNPHITTTAHRTANRGPFVCNTDQGYARIESGKSGLVRRGLAGENNPIADALGTNCQLSLQDAIGTPSLKVENIVMQAQLPMLEGIASAVASFRVRKRLTDDLRNVPAALVGIEGQYLAYSVFGSIADSHLGAAKNLGVSPFTPLDQLTGRFEQEVFLTYMLSASRMARNLETALYYLPSFLVSQDKELLRDAAISPSIAWGTAEQAYYRALGGIGPLISHVLRIDSMLNRLQSLRRAMSNDDGSSKFLPLGISAAASLISPFALIGAAQQGYSLWKRSDDIDAAANDTFADVFSSASAEWTYIVQTLLPAISHRFATEIYPVRLALWGSIAGLLENSKESAKETILDAISKRFAKLDTFKSFPSDNERKVLRRESIEFIYALQQNAQAFQFRDF